MPKLTLVSTPIGNLGDLSPRAASVLSESDIWIVEDTRVSAKLGSHLNLKKPMRVLNDHTSEFQVHKILADIKNGMNACLLTDGGSPSISDPGAILADLCLRSEIEVDSVPGPSAVTNALALSGFFAQRFVFLGFLPRKAGQIKGELEQFSDSALTLVLFESPHRLDTLLNSAFEVLGERRYAICREMTKMHQQVYRDFLPNVPSESSVPKKGEVTLVIEGRRRTTVSLESSG